MKSLLKTELKTEKDLEKFTAFRLCEFRVSSQPEELYKEHYRACEWCQAYVRQQREAKKYHENKVEPFVPLDDVSSEYK